MKPFPEDQHTVQEALLRGFAGKHEYLRERRRDGTDRRVASSKATAEKHFYSFVDSNGDLSSFVEDTLQTLESKLPKLRAELQTTGRLALPNKREFDLYVAYSLTRTRTVRDHMEQVGNLILPTLWRTEVASMFNIDLSRLTPETLSYFDQFSRGILALAPSPPHDAQIRQLRTFVNTADTFYRVLNHFRWTHVSFDEPCLVTSDAGIGVARPTSGGGLLPPNGTVFVPFSPTSVAIGTPRKKAPSATLSGRALERAVNESMVSGAFEQVLRHPDMDWPSYLQLNPDPPKLIITVTSRTMGASDEKDVDPGAELKRRYQKDDLHPFTRRLMEPLIDASPI